MPFVPVPSAILAEMRYNTVGGIAENTLWFTSPLDHDFELLTQLAVALEDWHGEYLRETQSEHVSLFSIRVTSMETATSTGIEFPLTPPVNGEIVGAIEPSNVTAAITFITQFRGRSNRGRNYVIGVPEDSVVGDTFVESRLNDIVAAYYQMKSDLLTAGFTHVVASRYSGVDEDGDPIPRISGQTTPVVNYRMDDTIDSQRRRLKNRGS